MREFLLLLPIIFIFHDMEEIIGFGWFFRNNPDIFKRFPIITKAYKDYTTAPPHGPRSSPCILVGLRATTGSRRQRLATQSTAD